jgi:hypothetical protein
VVVVWDSYTCPWEAPGPAGSQLTALLDAGVLRYAASSTRPASEGEWTWWAHTGGGTPLPANSPHGHMILRVELVGSHGR